MQFSSRHQLGALIRSRRRAADLTQATLARAAGLSVHSVTDMETGKGNPSITAVLRCLAALGLRLSVDEIGDGERDSQALLDAIIASHTVGDGR